MFLSIFIFCLEPRYSRYLHVMKDPDFGPTDSALCSGSLCSGSLWSISRQVNTQYADWSIIQLPCNGKLKREKLQRTWCAASCTYPVYTTLSNQPARYSSLGIGRGIVSTSAVERPSVYPCMTDQSHWIFMRHPSPYHIRLEPMWRESKGRGWQHCCVVRDPYSCVLNSTFAKWTCVAVWHWAESCVTLGSSVFSWVKSTFSHAGTNC